MEKSTCHSSINSDHQKPHKVRHSWTPICNSYAFSGRWETGEYGTVWEGMGQLAWHTQQWTAGDPTLSKIEKGALTPEVVLLSSHACEHTHTCSYMQMYTYTHIWKHWCSITIGPRMLFLDISKRAESKGCRRSLHTHVHGGFPHNSTSVDSRTYTHCTYSYRNTSQLGKGKKIWYLLQQEWTK